MKKLLKFLSSRVVVISLLILLQAAILCFGLFYLQGSKVINAILEFLSIVVVIYILSKPDNPMYKIAWIVPILIFPVFGGLFYLFFGKRKMSHAVKEHLAHLFQHTQTIMEQESVQTMLQLKEDDPFAYKQASYIKNKALAPIYQNTYSRFLSPGEEKLECMVEELKKAEHYIFLEYFIIEDGIMWSTILEILKQKVKEGVIVRIMYDDLGSVTTLSPRFPKEMEKIGIETRVFNPFRPSLDVFMNYRDHRKICVIDGNVGFTGGINIADEYINAYEKHGHWKDSSIVLKGDAVWNLTVLFLQLWANKKEEEYPDYQFYRPKIHYPTDGYVQPFGDSPLDEDLVGETTYMNIINNAKNYVYISTPYLILDNEMITALSTAAQSGVDVRIVCPHIADKWFVHAVTRSNYLRLIKAGVHIYEYTPGFIHAKTIVSDDKYAIVGTTNFDFRSFYLHFECGVFLYQTHSVIEVKEDYLEILKCSQQIELEMLLKTNAFVKLVQTLLAMFSPLM